MTSAEFKRAYQQGYSDAMRDFRERPQEPKTGHWITEDVFDGNVAYRCSECDELFWLESGTPKDNEYNYCPKCGMRLIEPKKSEGE